MNFWRRWRRIRAARRIDVMIRKAERLRDESYRRYKRARKLVRQLRRARHESFKE